MAISIFCASGSIISTWNKESRLPFDTALGSRLLAALDSGQISGAALDVFVGEPSPRADVLAHPAISLTPHTGAATAEAQDRIGLELASQIAELVK